MSHNIASVHLRGRRGEIKVQAMGRAPRGQRFLAGQLTLDSPGPGDPKFKSELLKAVSELMAIQEIPFP